MKCVMETSAISGSMFNMKRNEKVLLIGFLVIIFGILIAYPVNYFLINVTNSYEVKFSNFFEAEKEMGGLFNRLSTKIDNKKGLINNQIINYFPLYDFANVFDYKINNYLDSKLYSVFGYDFYPMGTNADGEYVYKNIKDNYYVLQSNYNSSELEERLNSQVEVYNNLATTGTNVFIYLPNRYEFRSISNNELTIRDMEEIEETFISKLDSSINVDKLDFADDYINYFYKTDHHWNSNGAVKAYEEISAMLGITPLSTTINEVPEISLRGSISKSIGDVSTYDSFSYVSAEIQEYEVTVNDGKVPAAYKPLELRKSENVFYDYYISFYNGMYAKVDYYFDGNEKNLLMIADSYAWPIDYLIASGYSHTTIINPRYIDEFDIGTYIKENDINDVLILMETQTTMFDQYNYGIAQKLGGIK